MAIKKEVIWRLWPVVFIGNGTGLWIVWNLLPPSMKPTLPVYGQFVFLAYLTTCLAAAPLTRFLHHGWQYRYDEFRNRLTNGALNAYLKQFWERRAAGAAPEILNAAADREKSYKAAEDLFDDIYSEQYGRDAFLIPFYLLLVAIFADSVLVLLMGLDGVNLGSASTEVGTAAIAGAYMFVVGDMVLNVRRKSLNVADVYWYVLRMVLAVPIGVAVSAAANTDATQASIAFCLGTLPVDALQKLMRRLMGRNLNDSEKDPAAASDQLIKLDGVTVPIASTLSAEGVDSIDQIIGMDPVLLAIRTGLPFKLILRLGSQAVVRRHLGDAVSRLAPFGLADAKPVAALVKLYDDKNPAAVKILDDARERLKGDGSNTPTLETTLFTFRNIAAESYTKFLLTNER